jgi:hypothetical protein
MWRNGIALCIKWLQRNETSAHRSLFRYRKPFMVSWKQHYRLTKWETSIIFIRYQNKCETNVSQDETVTLLTYQPVRCTAWVINIFLVPCTKCITDRVEEKSCSSFVCTFDIIKRFQKNFILIFCCILPCKSQQIVFTLSLSHLMTRMCRNMSSYA